MSEELQASGIDARVSESDAIIEDLFGKEDDAVDSGKDGKKKAEAGKKATKEIRTKAMERFGQSSKRNGDEGEGVKKKKRKSGSHAVEFLREKAKQHRSFSEGGGATAKERSTKQNTVVNTAATADESSLPFPCGQNVIEREELTV